MGFCCFAGAVSEATEGAFVERLRGTGGYYLACPGDVSFLVSGLEELEEGDACVEGCCYLGFFSWLGGFALGAWEEGKLT